MTIGTKQHIPPFRASQLEAIAKVLGDTSDGLTGSEISRFLRQKNVTDPGSGVTKWIRLHDAFADFQNRHRSGNLVLWMVAKAPPARARAWP